MHVTEHLAAADRTLFSFEIIPPRRGKNVREIIDMVEQILPARPPFIDVTSHMAEAVYEEQKDGTIQRRVSKKRPGTISICGIIQNRYRIDTVPHLLCCGFTREETEDAMIELNYLGIHNVLAIRGDESNYVKVVDRSRTRNRFARDLVSQLNDLRAGRYLEELANSEAISMCIGVGAYPEKHIEAPNMKIDIKYLQEKVAAGADYIVTQMFFDNTCFKRYVDLCREGGIDVPIIPGIKLIDSVQHLTSLPKNFHVSLPEELVDEIMQNPAHVREIGRRWAQRQVEDLMNDGVPCIHFFVMTEARSVVEMIQELD